MNCCFPFFCYAIATFGQVPRKSGQNFVELLGVVLAGTGDFVDVFLLDYGIRECCSKNNLYTLPEKFQYVPGHGVSY